jgi:hypothetical protein
MRASRRKAAPAARKCQRFGNNTRDNWSAASATVKTPR